MAVRIGGCETDTAAAKPVHVPGQQTGCRLRHRHVFLSGVLRRNDEKQEVVGVTRLQKVRRFAARRLGRELAERDPRFRHRPTSATQAQTTTSGRRCRRLDRSVRSHA